MATRFTQLLTAFWTMYRIKGTIEETAIFNTPKRHFRIIALQVTGLTRPPLFIRKSDMG